MNIYGKIVERLTSTYVILKSQDTKNEKEILNVSRVGVGGGRITQDRMRLRLTSVFSFATL